MPFLRERSGRWSPVKIVAFTATLLPALWIVVQGVTGDLGCDLEEIEVLIDYVH